MPDSRTGARTLNRDFKDVRRHSPGAPGQAFSASAGFGIGLALGLAVALAVHLHYRGLVQAAGEPVPAPSQTPASSVAADDAAVVAGDTPAEPELDFYDLLPKQEVEVPKGSRTVSDAGPQAPLPTGDVVLQAGSFKQATEAEKMQAQLALIGITAKIQRASVDDETWYRVRIGPIATVEELRGIQTKLREAEIDATAVTPAEESPLP
jgi:cell division protein FtsN